MPKICYVERNFSKGSMDLIQKAEEICAEYEGKGFSLTLRQLYYQFVARDLIPNKDTEYKRLGSVINDARLAGLIDWNHIEDRTRFVRSNSHWDSPGDIMRSAASSYAVDKWESQPFRCEAWIEKDALVGVIEKVCREEDVPFFSCRGYTSQSEVWGAAQRLMGHVRGGQNVRVIHLGDHDPSGIDMSRDIAERLGLFMRGTVRHENDSWTITTARRTVEVRRIALNMPQVEKYEPPPNPAKLTDSRCAGYIANYGDESWELDALSPETIAQLIEETINEGKDLVKWQRKVKEEGESKRLLNLASDQWHSLVDHIDRSDEPTDEEE